MNRSEASTTNSDTCKCTKTLMIARKAFQGLSSDLAVFLSVVRSDEEKGRQMWRKYLEREDSRIGGKCIDKKISASVVTHSCLRSHGDHFSWRTLLLSVALETKARVGGKGRQAFSVFRMPRLSLPRSLRWAVKELPDMHRLWLLLHSLRSLLGPLVAHCKGILSCGPSVSIALGALRGCVTSDLDPFSLQRGYPEVTLMDCMRLFTKEDILDGDEKPVSHSSVTDQPP